MSLPRSWYFHEAVVIITFSYCDYYISISRSFADSFPRILFEISFYRKLVNDNNCMPRYYNWTVHKICSLVNCNNSVDLWDKWLDCCQKAFFFATNQMHFNGDGKFDSSSQILNILFSKLFDLMFQKMLSILNLYPSTHEYHLNSSNRESSQVESP